LSPPVAWWAVRRYELSYRAASAKKIKNNKFERYDQRTNKNISNLYRGVGVLGRRCLFSGRFCSAWAGFFDLAGPVFS